MKLRSAFDTIGAAMLAFAGIIIILCNVPGALALYSPLPKLFLISFCVGICSLLIARMTEIVTWVVSNRDVKANRELEHEGSYDGSVVSLDDLRNAALDESISESPPRKRVG